MTGSASKREDGLTDAEYRKHQRILRGLRLVACPKCGGVPWVGCEHCQSTGVVCAQQVSK